VLHRPALLPVGGDRLRRDARIQAPAGLALLVPAGACGRVREPGDPPPREPVIPGNERGPGAQRGVARSQKIRGTFWMPLSTVDTVLRAYPVLRASWACE
jgi:hypothetical protein